jgi:NDP-sugar pyrophosphorylase family protein
MRDLVIAVGYRAELIETYFRDGSQLGVHIEYCPRVGTSRHGRPLGTCANAVTVPQRSPARRTRCS